MTVFQSFPDLGLCSRLRGDIRRRVRVCFAQSAPQLHSLRACDGNRKRALSYGSVFALSRLSIAARDARRIGFSLMRSSGAWRSRS